ncbi:hypothetical protein ABGB16_06605 [Micromonospora sp. B11E3]|uniref:hypothetical protein n=1 Tax=Micromonospora sp. B11E3 TaxID=3153562 RepID=UPI00325E3DB7
MTHRKRQTQRRGPAPAHPPAPQPHQALTARLTYWSAAEQVVADVVAALNTTHGTPLTVALLDTPVGSDHLPATNTIVLSTRYATPGLAAGLAPTKAGSDIGCKRWEKHDIAREGKDQGWNTVTLDFEVALSYARQHTEWAMGMKRNEPTLRDVADEGGLVLAFDVPKTVVDGSNRWRRDNSGDRNFRSVRPAVGQGIGFSVTRTHGSRHGCRGLALKSARLPGRRAPLRPK